MTRTVLAALTVSLLGATLAASKWSELRPASELAAPLASLPASLGGWQAVAHHELGERTLERLQPTSYLLRDYERGSARLGLFVAYYAQQRAGETMHSPRHCLPGSGWEIWRYGSAEVAVGGSRHRINHYSIQKAGDRLLVLYWYQSRSRVIASEYLGKALLVRDALMGGETSGSLVRLTLPDEPGRLEDGLAFAAALLPEMGR